MGIKGSDFESFGRHDFSNIGKMGGPPRKFSLTDEETALVQEAKERFEGADISIEALYNFFNDWQSNKTKSSKRFVLSLSFLLTLTLLAGVKILEIDLFGVSVSEGWEKPFLISVLVMHITSFIYFIYLKSIDLSVQKARISTIENDLNELVQLAKKIDQIVKENDLISAKVLFNDFRNPITDIHRNDIKVYDAIKFYEEKLESQHFKSKWGETAENVVIWFLYVLGLIAIILSF